MGEDIDTQFLLAGLDQAHVGEHALVLESAREFGRDGGIRVQSGEGDQLEDESGDVSFLSSSVGFNLPVLGKIPDKRLQGSLVEPLTHPVE